MAKRYIIWDHSSNVITPSGDVFTPEEWLNKYPKYRDNNIIMVLANCENNGALIDSVAMMQFRAEAAGAIFPEGLSDHELLDAVEQFEDDYAAAQQAAAAEAAAQEAEYAAASLTAEQDVAAALAYKNMMDY